MILQALHDYYARKPELPRDGFELKDIPFVIELEADGRPVQILDTRELVGKRKQARGFLVPQGVKKSVNVAANLLWGNAEYVLGIADAKKLAERQAKGKETEYRARLTEMRAAFIEEIRHLPEAAQQDGGVQAVLAFAQLGGDEIVAALGELGSEISETNPNLTFRLRSDVDLVCQRPAVSAAIMKRGAPSSALHCLVSGEMDEIERLHSSISGVRDAQSSGASLVSFNLDAFCSYGKDQGRNAPVGKRAAFAYTTALKHLLRRDSPQKLQVGDTTTVFWADHETSLENDFAVMFDEPRKDDADPDRGTRAVAALLSAVRQGVGPVLDDKTRFFVLGLAPNAARIAIRFWLTGTVADMTKRIVRHFDSICIDPPKHDPQFLSLQLLLRSIATPSKKWPGGDPENIPPNLAGEVMRAVLEGLPYPETLFGGAIRRIRAQRDVNYPRAAILKACLNRKRTPYEKEITVSLDKENANPGYRLGRLFAVLERIQEEAAGGPGKINATIRDRYYGAFSATPATVFATLMRMKNHHLAKLDNPGRRVNLEKLVGEIVDGLMPTLPAHLPLADQGRFAIGYYHQRQDFFTKRESVITDPSITAKE
ncbi:MAG: type I-C CRISPR-associated protein Cas8c/Csd1 [Gammaproteobacteria bacterium]|nr:type I-C CRISPR-associated protein Cas8c/Csd1 [Rhodocyclaceae bacterium]MBU3908048.1 type I-C CRISPR-associated protein Cas8c/Csd1 [Gammaproteobacteria bacterium]MBU3990341.1 type I-C CRISPR-associated protein Cas8c/Csd1 [Gammaproteobacteria bacterium]MBU4006005.1 type I-C CRISPR-associated protein Cas8c/Csd1 [Gammaproteobacteria bacterium]MBU4022022.1 type I-C CRISPR-associated protein Cas8c/Csd1 [Gammaproteobacteria bacterium]